MHHNFSPSAARLHNFCDKVLQDDHHAKFDHNNLCRVRCSSCTKWVNMRVLYKLRRWSEHHQSPACQAKQSTALRTSLLHHYGFSRTTTQLSPQSTPLAYIDIPCPSLDHQADPRISRYLQRSSTVGGGAHSRTSLAAYLFSGRTWKDLLFPERQVVLCQEESEFIWRNNQSYNTFSVHHRLQKASWHTQHPRKSCALPCLLQRTVHPSLPNPHSNCHAT